MSNIYLCVGKYAQTPYYIQDAGLHIYSVEELCYYLMENIHILSRGIMRDELATWLEQECELPELAESLHTVCKKNATIKMFVRLILSYTHYATNAEIEDLEQILDASVAMNDFQKRKLRADYCFRSKLYEKALNMYLQLLSETNKNDFDMAAKLYHNIGTIYTARFSFSKAAEAYLLAYQINGSIESRRAYIMAKRLELSDEEYKAFCENRAEWEEDFRWVAISLTHSMQKWNVSEEKNAFDKVVLEVGKKRDTDYYKNVGIFVNELKAEYRKQNE